MRPDGSTPSVSEKRISVACFTSGPGSPSRRFSWSVAPSRRAASRVSGSVFDQPPVTACSTTAGLNAPKAAVTTLQGAFPKHALRLQKYPSK